MTDTAGKIRAALAELQDEYFQPHDLPWILAYSAGKDSTLLLHLVFEMLLSLPPSERRRPIYVVSNDTLVESPLLAQHMRKSLGVVTRAAESLRLPMTTHVTVPKEDQTFWVNVIGRGYMPPNRGFRWCTDRMKIAPTTAFVKEHVSRAGQVILLVGVRRTESAERAKQAAKFDERAQGSRLNPHSDLRGCMVFRPILEFSTEEVWQTLLQRHPPWGGSHRDLITLYRNAQAGECPLVIDRAQAPSCGSSSGRFGCWTCTVVAKDKSAEALADAGYEEYGPLVEFRDWLKELEHDSTKRHITRRDGTLKVVTEHKTVRRPDGSKETVESYHLLYGPFNLDGRMLILEKLLALQAELGMELITEQEIELIKKQWATDMVAYIQRCNAGTEGAQRKPKSKR